MKTLPNSVTVFNGTPHVIQFWHPEWSDPIGVDPDTVISATVEEGPVIPDVAYAHLVGAVKLVNTHYVGNDEARKIIADAMRQADVVIGSIIAAQAYPGNVLAMVPAKGYERVPPAEKRMRPDKFTIF